MLRATCQPGCAKGRSVVQIRESTKEIEFVFKPFGFAVKTVHGHYHIARLVERRGARCPEIPACQKPFIDRSIIRLQELHNLRMEPAEHDRGFDNTPDEHQRRSQAPDVTQDSGSIGVLTNAIHKEVTEDESFGRESIRDGILVRSPRRNGFMQLLHRELQPVFVTRLSRPCE